MANIRTPCDLRNDSRDEPRQTQKDLGGSHNPRLDQSWCGVLVTPKTPIECEVSGTPAGPHEFGKGYKPSVLEGDQDIPRERSRSMDHWTRDTSLSSSLESPGFRFQESGCEGATGSRTPTRAGNDGKHGTCMSAATESPRFPESSGFKTPPLTGDQQVPTPPVDDQENHGTCMPAATMDTLESQDTGCETAVGSNVSSVKADERGLPRPPKRASQWSLGVINTAWVWMWAFQNKDGEVAGKMGKYGLPICISAIIVVAVATIACTLQYAVLPNVNPLHHQDKKGWWYCPFNCTLIWMPNCVAYIGIMLEQFVFAGSGVQLTYLDLFLMWLAGSITMDSLLIVLSRAPPKYPFPLSSLIAAPAAFTGIAIVFRLCIFPRLERAVPVHDARQIARKSVLVFIIFVWSICLLLLLLLLLAMLNRTKSESLKVLVVLCVGMIREVCRVGSEKVAVLLHPKAAIIGQNLAMACFGVGLTMVVGNSSSILLTGVILLQDIFRGMFVGIMIGNVLIGQFNLSVFLLHLQPGVQFKLLTGGKSKLTETELEQQRSTLRSNLIASETGEVILPVAYLCSWLAVRVGPYRSSFTGIGTSDYGIDPPERMSSFVMFTIVLIVSETMSVMFLKLLLHYFVKVAITFDEHYIQFGRLLTVQNTWVVHTCFCVSMISCGFDYNLQWESPSGNT